MKSKSFSTANFRSSLSFSVREGSRMCTSGMLMLLLLESVPPFSTSQWIFLPSILRTTSSTSPSSTSTRQPSPSSL